MEEIHCKICGKHDFKKIEENTYKCTNCEAVYRDNETEKYKEELKEVFSNFLDENERNRKEEELSNLRINLYEAIHSKYISNTEIKDRANDIKRILPKDLFANFFYYAGSENITGLNDYIKEINFNTQNKVMVNIIVEFLLKSPKLLVENIQTLLNEIIDTCYSEEERVKYYAKYTEKMQEKDEGFFAPNITRDVFIAYSSSDKKEVLKIVEELEKQKFKCFVSFRNLKHSGVENYQRELEIAIDNCTVFLFVSSTNSRRIDCEALSKEMEYIKQKDKAILPPEYRNTPYKNIPDIYKKRRIEYILEDYRNDKSLGENITNEFFSGKEWVANKDYTNLAKRIYELINQPVDQTDKPTTVENRVIEGNNGGTYTGEWKNDQRNGEGTMTFKNNDIYEGNWINDERSGKGKLTYKNGDIYDGNWKNDKKHGKGKLTYADGRIINRKWKNDELQLNFMSFLVTFLILNILPVLTLSTSILSILNVKPFSIFWNIFTFSIFSTDVWQYVVLITSVLAIISGLYPYYKTYNAEKSFKQNISGIFSKYKKPEFVKNVIILVFTMISLTTSSLILLNVFDNIIINDDYMIKVEKIAENYSIKAIHFYNSNEEFTIPTKEIGGKELVNIVSISDSLFAKRVYKAGNIQKIIIPDEIQIIGKNAFKNCKNLKEIVLNDSIQQVGDGAFSGCDNLKTNTDEIGIRYIGTSKNPYFILLNVTNKNIEQIDISDQNTKFVMDNAFYDCQKLKEIKFSVNLVSIGKSAFEKCYYLEKISSLAFSSEEGKQFLGYLFGVKSYKEQSQFIPDSFKEVTFSNQVTTIGDYAFYDCKYLTSISIPQNILYLGKEAFYNCVRISKIEWNTDRVSELTSESNAFYNTGKDTDGIDVVFGDNIKIIPKYLFYNDNENYVINIKSVVVGSGVTKIEDYAFKGCANLVGITIGENVEYIGDSVFRGCTGLTSVNYSGTIDNWVKIDFATSYSNPIYYTKKLLIDNQEQTQITINSDNIGSYSFYGCESLTNVTFGENVTTIGSYSFYGCTGLNEIIIPDNVVTIGSYTFSNCTGLTDVSVNKNTTSIEENAFKGCTELEFTITYLNTKNAVNENVTTYTPDSDTIFLSDLYIDGYTFDGWYDSNVKVTQITSGSVGNIILTANWSLIEYDITYSNTKGATNTNKTNYNIESDTFELSEIYVDGYTFDGWYENNQKVTEIIQGSFGHKELTAKWSIIQYNITYHLYNGTNGDNPETYNIEDKITLLNASKNGYTFNGWYKEESFENRITEIKQSFGNLNLYAKWNTIQYNITYSNTKGATNTNKTSYNIESDTFELSEIYVDGYTFDGWYENNQKVTEIIQGSFGHKELTAKWSIIQYNITYHLYNGTNGDNPETYNIEDKITLLNASKNGYTFGGWYKEESFENRITEIKQSFGNLDLYAKFEANK